jgi:MoxR-like ATPase
MNDIESRLDLSAFSQRVDELKAKIGEVVVGQQQAVDLILTALLANGHVLIEGVPGVAKTLTARLVAKLIDAEFSRIQFTPDLMPSDVLGTSVFNLKTSEFDFHKGPIFSEIVLIDEINRAPAKTQAALFEVMEERQVTVDGVTRKMGDTYMVLATQNPVEHEGTYRLPEAQLDRFLVKIVMDYPSLEQDLEILCRHHQNIALTRLGEVQPLLSKVDIAAFRQLVSRVVVDESLLRYVAAITVATRGTSAVYLGASPRASVALLNAAKAFALLQGRDFVIPDDVKFLAVPVLQHRIVLSPETEMSGKNAAAVVRQLVDSVEVPK